MRESKEWTMNRTSLLVLVAGLAVAMAACTPDVTVEAPSSTADAPSGISVSGQGQVTGTPDTLTMTFGVQVRRDSVSEAVSVAADRADAVIDALKAAGVADEDIQTANYSVWPEYDWTENQQRLIGYQVSNSVIAKIRDLDSAGETIDSATQAGGDDVTVNGVSFSIEDNEELIEAARQAAWDNARAKADQLAALSGVTLGAPTSINETFAPSPTPFRYEEASLAAGDVATPIVPGEQAVTVSISVQFSISN